jgi:hypothetical protein
VIRLDVTAQRPPNHLRHPIFITTHKNDLRIRL